MDENRTQCEGEAGSGDARLEATRESQLDLIEWLLVAGYLHTDLTCAELVDLYRGHRAIPAAAPEDDTAPADMEPRR
jgi:hypothetical protein